jgi:hypothetical protein
MRRLSFVDLAFVTGRARYYARPTDTDSDRMIAYKIRFRNAYPKVFCQAGYACSLGIRKKQIKYNLGEVRTRRRVGRGKISLTKLGRGI